MCDETLYYIAMKYVPEEHRKVREKKKKPIWIFFSVYIASRIYYFYSPWISYPTLLYCKDCESDILSSGWLWHQVQGEYAEV